MKFLHLHLRAFGPFTDKWLNLSGESGLHLLYGPNEAGKSSSLRAISDLLFGIPSKTPDRFLHPYDKLRIGAELQHSDGTRLEVVRRKGRLHTLRQADDATRLDEAELTRLLGEVDRDFFQTMFGIDQERLQRGGETMAEGNGQLGEVLFAAGAGLDGLQQVQTDLQSDINALLKPSGRSGAVQEGLKELAENRRLVKELQVTVATWKSHDEALRVAEKEKEKRSDAIRAKKSEQGRLRRIGEAVLPIRRWREAKVELAAIGEVPLLADDFAERSSQVLVELKRLEPQKEDAEASIAKLKEKLSASTLPEALLAEALLAEAEAIESLRDRRGEYQKAMADRPGLELDQKLSEKEAKEILRNLSHSPDLSEIESLRLPADKTLRIQELGNRQEGVVERLEGRRRECESLRRGLVEIESKIEAKVDRTELPEDVGRLRTSVEQAQAAGDLEAQVEAFRNELNLLDESAVIALGRLPLWTGSLADLEPLAVPLLSTLDKLDEELREKQNRVDAMQERLLQATKERKQAEVQLEQLELDQEVPTSEQLRLSRQLRERGWLLVVEAWGKSESTGTSTGGAAEEQAKAERVEAFVQQFPPATNLADAYGRSAAEADRIADLLRTDAKRVAEKAALQATCSQQQKLQSRWEGEIDLAQAERQQVEANWQQLWKPFGFEPLSPIEMRDWHRQQQKLVQLAESIREKQRQADQAKQQVERLTKGLKSALQQAKSPRLAEGSSLVDWLLLAKAECDAMQEAKIRLEQLQNDQQAESDRLAETEARLKEAQEEATQWEVDWAAEMQRLGLEDDAMPVQAQSVLTNIGRLFQKHESIDKIRIRLEDIDRDARQFEQQVSELTHRIAPDLAGTSPFTGDSAKETVGKLATRLREAESSAKEQTSLQERRNEQQRKLDQASAKMAEVSASLDEMCRQAECQAYESLAKVANQSIRHQELRKLVRDFEQEILRQSGGEELQAFLQVVEQEAANIDSIEPRIDELESEIEQLTLERDDFLRTVVQEETELQKMDGNALAAEKAAKCESIASRLENQLHELAVLRVASACLHAGIEQHRKKNEGPLLRRASEIFQQITLGGFERLRADFNDRGKPVLVGIRGAEIEGATEGASRGDSVEIVGMSDGTRDQLYLALRLASLETWLDHHEPIPFIVDDLLIHFDDQRAAATLQVLAQLSRRTQVLFFTHHSHLVALAREHLSSDDLQVTNLCK